MTTSDWLLILILACGITGCAAYAWGFADGRRWLRKATEQRS